jgi:pimeloyl-ACP methyl ester carboxylesterase
MADGGRGVGQSLVAPLRHAGSTRFDSSLSSNAVDTRELEHDSTGEGEPPLVLLPGGLTGWQSYLPLLEPLAGLGHRVVRVQPIVNAEGLAGHAADPSYGTNLERDSFWATMDALAIDRMHLLGWSSGGRMALDVALTQPERIVTLTVVEPAAWWLADTPDVAAFESFIERIAGTEVTDSDLVEFLVRAGLGPEGTDFSALPQWAVWTGARNTLSWYGARASAEAKAWLEGLAGLQPPLLVLRGKETSPWLASAAQAVADVVPSSSLIELEGGHACILQDTPGFLAALGPHLARAS